MRVGFLMHYFRTGGLEELVIRLSLAYQARGHEAVVIAYEPGPLQKELESKGVRTLLLEKGDGFRPQTSWSLYRVFAQERLDLLHTHHFGPLIYGVPAAWACQVPVVHTVHSNEHLVDGTPWRHRQMFSTFVRRVFRVTTVNEELKFFLDTRLGLPRSKTCVIRNGVDESQFHGEYDRTAILEDVGVPQDGPIVGIVARVEEEKGHRYLLEAMGRMKQFFRLVVVGTGSQCESLKRQAEELGLSERIHWLGLRRDIPALLSTLDLFVLPSLREGLPLALLEALVSGIPAVVSSVGGMPSVMEKSGGGVCVEPGNPNALAEALGVFLDDAAMRKERGVKGRRWVQENYSQNVMVERYLSLYEEAITSYQGAVPLLGVKRLVSWWGRR